MHLTGRFDAETLERVADTLAADKVEFGRVSNPSDQAVEIIKAVARKG